VGGLGVVVDIKWPWSKKERKEKEKKPMLKKNFF